MRIITGRAKGIRLKTLEGDATRPTAERVKESVFSMLQFDIDGRTVLDLFAGSGQMGLEAVSRGAAHATMVDQSKDAIRIIQENTTKTKLAADCTIWQGFALDFIRRNQGKQFDLVFLDPPYASDLYAATLQALLDGDMLKETSLVICESDTEEIFRSKPTVAERFSVQKSVRYGRVVVTILGMKQEEEC